MKKKPRTFFSERAFRYLLRIVIISCVGLLLTASLIEAAEQKDSEVKIPGLLMRASKLIGHTVRNPLGQEIGEIDDIIIDEKGQVYQVILSFGGILGIGDKLVAIPFDSLEIVNEWTYRTRYNPDGTAEKIPWEITQMVTFIGDENALRKKPMYHYGYSDARGGTTGWGRYSYPPPGGPSE